MNVSIEIIRVLIIHLLIRTAYTIMDKHNPGTLKLVGAMITYFEWEKNRK